MLKICTCQLDIDEEVKQIVRRVTIAFLEQQPADKWCIQYLPNGYQVVRVHDGNVLNDDDDDDDGDGDQPRPLHEVLICHKNPLTTRQQFLHSIIKVNCLFIHIA